MKQSNLWQLIAAVLLLSIEIIAVFIYICSFVPLVWNDPFLKGVEPERETLFYMTFVATSSVLMAVGVKWVLPKMDEPIFRRQFNTALALEALWSFLMVFCFFKWTTYRYPFWNILAYENSTWLQPFFCVVCVLSAVSKIFLPEVEILHQRWRTFAGSSSYPRGHSIVVQAVFIAGVFLLLYIPRLQDVTALALAWDQWNHLDCVAGWFIKQGWQVSYEQTIQILVIMAIAYVVAIFYLIRQWLESWFLAGIGALLTIKMGMFYYSSTPCSWINPSNTFLAHGWDIFLFAGLWIVSIKFPKYFYAIAAFIGALLIGGWFKSNGLIDVLGMDNQPMMLPLRVRQFFPFFMGYFVPLFYVFSLLVLMGQKSALHFPQKRMPVVLCVYGLMIFVDYIAHPAIGFYGSLMVPAILVMLWWLKYSTSSWVMYVQRSLYAGILLLALGALLTNRLMLTYPNSIFQDRQRFVQERAYAESFMAIKSSAALIEQLTHEDQKVVVLSNFETALLMHAHRQPLFDDFPVMSSSLTNVPGGLNLKTKKQCLKLIDSLNEENALYVFVDARLLGLSPQALGNSGLNEVLDYLRNHYQFYTRQEFLVVFQRR